MKSKYIAQSLIDNHLAVIDQVESILTRYEGTKEGELFQFIVSENRAIHRVFNRPYYSLDSILSLMHGLTHWIEDDGELSIVRKLDEGKVRRRSILNLDLEDCYTYSIDLGYLDDAAYATIDDLLYLIRSNLEEDEYYKTNRECIENRGVGNTVIDAFREKHRRPCYIEYSSFGKNRQDYLKNKFSERFDYEQV